MDHTASTSFGGSFTAAPREKDSFFQKVFENCSDALLVVDPAGGRVVDANPRACELLDYRREDLVSLPLSVIHPRGGDAFRTAAPTEWRTRAGETVAVELSIASAELDGRSCVIATARPQARTGESDGPGPLHQLATHLTLRDLRTLEREIIERALDTTAGKIYGDDGAAALLGLPPTTLASRLKRLGIEKARTNGSQPTRASA